MKNQKLIPATLDDDTLDVSDLPVKRSKKRKTDEAVASSKFSQRCSAYILHLIISIAASSSHLPKPKKAKKKESLTVEQDPATPPPSQSSSAPIPVALPSPMTRRVNELLASFSRTRPGISVTTTRKAKAAMTKPHSPSPPPTPGEEPEPIVNAATPEEIVKDKPKKRRKKKANDTADDANVDVVPNQKDDPPRKKKKSKKSNLVVEEHGEVNNVGSQVDDSAEQEVDDHDSGSQAQSANEEVGVTPADEPTPQSLTISTNNNIATTSTLSHSPLPRPASPSPLSSSSSSASSHSTHAQSNELPSTVDLDTLDPESLLRPTQAQIRQARSSLDALLLKHENNIGREEIANESDASDQDESEVERSSTPSDIIRTRRRQGHQSARQGYRSASDDDSSEEATATPSALLDSSLFQPTASGEESIPIPQAKSNPSRAPPDIPAASEQMAKIPEANAGVSLDDGATTEEEGHSEHGRAKYSRNSGSAI